MFRKKSYFLVILPGSQDIQISNVKWYRGELKKETESLVYAEQEQPLKTNSVAYTIDKTSEIPLCCHFQEKSRKCDPHYLILYQFHCMLVNGCGGLK